MDQYNPEIFLLFLALVKATFLFVYGNKICVTTVNIHEAYRLKNIEYRKKISMPIKFLS